MKLSSTSAMSGCEVAINNHWSLSGAVINRTVSPGSDEPAEECRIVDLEDAAEHISQPRRVIPGVDQNRQDSRRILRTSHLRANFHSIEHKPRKQIPRDLLRERPLEPCIGNGAAEQLKVFIHDEAVWLDHIQAVMGEETDLAIAGVEPANQRAPQIACWQCWQPVVLVSC